MAVQAGAKLCMVAELLGASGSLTAVDISRPRLAACRTMLQKYGLGSQTRLYLGDGTSFSFLPLREAAELSPARPHEVSSDMPCTIDDSIHGNLTNHG